MIEYKGYTGVFEFDPSIDAFHGHVLGLQDVVTFEGRSVDELRREMGESVDDYLDFCAQESKEPERPYRGEFLVRTTPEVHRAAATAAEAEGMSLNAWVETALTAVAAQSRPPRTRTSKSTLTTARRPGKRAAAKKGRTGSAR